MGGLIEAVLVALLVGIFTLLGVWLSGWQERKRARESREADKEKMLYEKQLEVLEEAIKFLTFMSIEWGRCVGDYEKLLANRSSEEWLSVLGVFCPSPRKGAFQESGVLGVRLL